VDTTAGVFEGLFYNFTRREINISYISRSGSFIAFPDFYAICPWRQGITSTWERLGIKFEFIGSRLFKLHTIEIHNKNECNVETMNALRLNFLFTPYDPFYLYSQLLNDRAVIDVDYYKSFLGLNLNIEPNLDILEVNFLSTKNKEFPTNCQLRLFIEENESLG